MLIKSRAAWGDIIHAPTTHAQPGAPVCMTCGRFLDEYGIVEGTPLYDANGSLNLDATTWAKYLVRHHGAEELRTFDMGSTNWDYADVEQMARRTNWFDPRRHEGLGLGVRIEQPGEHDGR